MTAKPDNDERSANDETGTSTRFLLERLDRMESTLLEAQRRHELQLYQQLEAFHWLTRRLSFKGRLPPLRGWPLSPDVLLILHEWISRNKPDVVVEFGSGISTLVIADALFQNGGGHLVSFDHSPWFGQQTREWLESEALMQSVTLNIDGLVPWAGEHLNQRNDQAKKWYSPHQFEGLADIDFVLVDGPPGKICDFARYPALPAIAEQLSPGATIWLDDAARDEEKHIAEQWAQSFDCELSYHATEKGLAVLKRRH